MNTDDAVSFVYRFDVSAMIAAERETEADANLVDRHYQEAKNLVVLAIKNPRFGVVPTKRGDRHSLFENYDFLKGLRVRGIEFKHIPEAAGDFPRTVELYHAEFGIPLIDAMGMIDHAGCLLEAKGAAAGCLLEAVSRA